MNGNWIKFLLLILAGFIAGAAVAGWYFENQNKKDGKDRYSRVLEKFSERLNLTDEQNQKIGKILEEKRKKISALRAEVRPRFQEIRQAAREEIRRLLTPDQQKEFDQMQAEWENRRKKKHEKDHR